jgi:hypothetical protein
MPSSIILVQYQPFVNVFLAAQSLGHIANRQTILLLQTGQTMLTQANHSNEGVLANESGGISPP